MVGLHIIFVDDYTCIVYVQQSLRMRSRKLRVGLKHECPGYLTHIKLTWYHVTCRSTTANKTKIAECEKKNPQQFRVTE